MTTLKGLKRAAARRIAIRIQQQLVTADTHGLLIVVQEDGSILVCDRSDDEVMAVVGEDDREDEV